MAKPIKQQKIKLLNALYQDFPVKGLPLHLTTLGLHASLLIRYGSNNLAPLIVSREAIFHLKTIEKDFVALSVGFDFHAGIIIKYCQAHMTSNKKGHQR
ncbi:hypothetical protein ACUN3I_21320 [Hafnia alvei]